METRIEILPTTARRKCCICNKLIPEGTTVFTRFMTVTRQNFFVPGFSDYHRAHYAHLACGREYLKMLGRETVAELPTEAVA